jgi:hypothetical protein
LSKESQSGSRRSAAMARTVIRFPVRNSPRELRAA